MASQLSKITFLELRNVNFDYGGRAILENVSLKVPLGKVTALIGASGGGKTTILRLCSGQIKASSGEVLLHDGDVTYDIGKLSREKIYEVRRQMGMLFQFGALFTDMSVFENVAFPLQEHTNLPEEIIRDIVLMKLNTVGLRGARDLMPGEISGGMARRVALARAIALDPALVMYDEPFSGLDPISLGITGRLIRQLNDVMRLTSIMVSHDLDITFRIADHIVVLANAHVVAEGSPKEVLMSTDPLVHQFVNALPDGPVRFHYPSPSTERDFLQI
jgi:phospholipid/cholesterol/gamma-HCH transport system ATP-binding protein